MCVCVPEREREYVYVCVCMCVVCVHEWRRTSEPKNGEPDRPAKG